LSITSSITLRTKFYLASAICFKFDTRLELTAATGSLDDS